MDSDDDSDNEANADQEGHDQPAEMPAQADPVPENGSVKYRKLSLPKDVFS